ncbi:MAG: MOSC domain-containing protein [Spirochaetaceae bacterium]|jgi:molybdenum cofactor synthesis domain-containing protein|nr:MOSC domain-containing protein [Spirochaetaceae bacterium]
MGKIRAVCLSAEKGTAKRNVGEGEFIAGHGLKGDAHAGDTHRQVSLLSYRKAEAFRASGAEAPDGAFGENLLVDGIELSALPIGTVLRCGEAAFEITQIGKECHNRCEIFKRMGDCIMPREGVFARVIHGGVVKTGDDLYAPYRIGVVTASDRGAKGERKDQSGPVIQEIVRDRGYEVASYRVLSDEQEELEAELKRLCDELQVSLVLTTGGTGFSPRDRMPEATLNVAERQVPGIPEALRRYSVTLTKRAMLSRAAAGIRGRTLIINLPGSPKAVREHLEYLMDTLEHGLDVLTGRDGDCAGP